MRPSIRQNGKVYSLLGESERFQTGIPLHFQIGETDVAAVRIGEKIYAFDNACPHEGTSLCDGHVGESTIMCHKHGWTFSLETGARTDIEDKTVLRRFEVIEQDDMVWCCLA